MREAFAAARAATESASELVQQLLRTARGEVAADVGTVDLGAVVMSAVKICRSTFSPDLRLGVRMPSEPVPVRITEGRLRNLALNLLLNAPRIGVEVHVDGDQAVLEVSDNGIGMDAATVERLGEPFFTTKGPSAGTGLGLAITKGLVELLDGTITIDSVEGRGTTVSVRLPAGVDAAGTTSG